MITREIESMRVRTQDPRRGAAFPSGGREHDAQSALNSKLKAADLVPVGLQKESPNEIKKE